MACAHRPVYFGMEHIPSEGPVLLVGNHTIIGFLDMPLTVHEIWRQRGRVMRGMADTAHFWVPVWRDVITRLGGVVGTRANCHRLLTEGEAVLTYPGGGREVAKRKGEKYQLICKQSPGGGALCLRYAAADASACGPVLSRVYVRSAPVLRVTARSAARRALSPR
jgi:1-acyl-sn-glycerol-3-phosphate acyltransferase